MSSLSPASRQSLSPRKAWRRSTDASRLCNPHLRLKIDLGVVRRNVEAIADAVGVALLPVVKADAYGLGAEMVCDAIADLAEGFCVFQAAEAIAIDLVRRTGKRVLAMGPPESVDPTDYLSQRITPAVSNPAQARHLRKARPALCVDTGMQRFACTPVDCRAALIAGDCREAFTHATKLAHVETFKDLTDGFDLTRHAAASILLHEPQATLDAVRPGLVMYRGAVCLTSAIVECHVARGPAGYSEFTSERHGVILAGYAHGLRKGPCRINGRSSRLLEVGMQSAFVELAPDDRVGDDVVLLNEDLTEIDLSQHWNCGPHEVLTSLSSAATRRYGY